MEQTPIHKKIDPFLSPLLSALLLACFVTSCGTEATGPSMFTLTTSVSPAEGGSVSPAQGSFEDETAISLQATPSEGWLFSGWQGDLVSTANPLNLAMTKDFTMIGSFEKRLFPLTVNIEGEGSVTETIVQAKTDYEHGTLVELEAIPADGWGFVGWSGETESDESTIQILVDESKTVNATFGELGWHAMGPG